jgi:hypothetical protein
MNTLTDFTLTFTKMMMQNFVLQGQGGASRRGFGGRMIEIPAQ